MLRLRVRGRERGERVARAAHQRAQTPAVRAYAAREPAASSSVEDASKPPMLLEAPKKAVSAAVSSRVELGERPDRRRQNASQIGQVVTRRVVGVVRVEIVSCTASLTEGAEKHELERGFGGDGERASARSRAPTAAAERDASALASHSGPPNAEPPLSLSSASANVPAPAAANAAAASAEADPPRRARPSAAAAAAAAPPSAAARRLSSTRRALSSSRIALRAAVRAAWRTR